MHLFGLISFSRAHTHKHTHTHIHTTAIEGVILFEPRIINDRVGCNPNDTAYERHYISYDISHIIQSYQRALASESGADSGSGNGN